VVLHIGSIADLAETLIFRQPKNDFGLFRVFLS